MMKLRDTDTGGYEEVLQGFSVTGALVILVEHTQYVGGCLVLGRQQQHVTRHLLKHVLHTSLQLKVVLKVLKMRNICVTNVTQTFKCSINMIKVMIVSCFFHSPVLGLASLSFSGAFI